MAKTGTATTTATTVGGSVPSAAAELRRELKRLLKTILDEEEENCGIEVIDRAQEALAALRDIKANFSSSAAAAAGVGIEGGEGGGDKEVEVMASCPERFRCPLSKQVMRDPVVIASGQTYDRPFIQKWLNTGQRTCPQTQQVLSHRLLAPNHLIKEMISDWCEKRGIKLPAANPSSVFPDVLLMKGDRDSFFSLLEKVSSAMLMTEKKAAAKELRLMTKGNSSVRALFGESSDALTKLLRPLSVRDIPCDLHEDLITTLLNISIYDSNRKLIAETPRAIPMLIEALSWGTIQTRSNAAAALFSLSALDSNKVLIGESGALGPLLDLLEEANPLVMNDAAAAVYNLCINHENRERAVHEGAVVVILTKIKENSHVDLLLPTLALLSSHRKAMEEMTEQGGVQCLLNVIRETSCQRNKENCIAILYSICTTRTKLREVQEEEHLHGTISRLAEEGTSRSQRKANGILSRLNRLDDFTHTA
ncbi:U-box domain-containing protein [Drosera capensis]